MPSTFSSSQVIERSFLLALRPSDRMEFSGDLLGEIEANLHIKNLSNTRQAYKIRGTSNKMFKIMPAVGVVESKKSVDVKILYISDSMTIPKNNEHHFCVYHIPAPEYSYPVGVWKEHYGEAQGEKRIHAIFVQRPSIPLSE